MIQMIFWPGRTVADAGVNPVPVMRISRATRGADDPAADVEALPPPTCAVSACQPPMAVTPIAVKTRIPTMAAGMRDAAATGTRTPAGMADRGDSESSSYVARQWGCMSLMASA